MVNLVALIICLAGAILQWNRGNMDYFIIECVFVLLNLPFVIIFFKQLYEDWKDWKDCQ